MDPSPSFVFCFFKCHSSSHSNPSPFLCSFGPKKALLALPGDDDERQSGRVTAEWECRESLDVWTQLCCRFVLLRHPEVKHEAVGAPYWQADAASAAPLPKPTVCYPCREQSGIIRFSVSLMFFVRTAEQEHRHFVIFVPGEKSRRRREKKRGGMPQQLQQQKLSSSPGSRSYAQITSL